MGEKVFAYGQEFEIIPCSRCDGTGHLLCWVREHHCFEPDEKYLCEKCSGARFILAVPKGESNDF